MPAHLAENLQINLNGHDFKIIKHITSSGEAEIYLLQGSNAQVVLKYYFSNYRPKDEIITRLHALKRRDIMSPLDSGVYQDRFFELSEYMTGGTLDSAMPLTSVDTIKKYAALIAEALNACHQNGIIHRDIKPVNIFPNWKQSNSSRKVIVTVIYSITGLIPETNILNRTFKEKHMSLLFER